MSFYFREAAVTLSFAPPCLFWVSHCVQRKKKTFNGVQFALVLFGQNIASSVQKRLTVLYFLQGVWNGWVHMILTSGNMLFTHKSLLSSQNLPSFLLNKMSIQRPLGRCNSCITQDSEDVLQNQVWTVFHFH